MTLFVSVVIVLATVAFVAVPFFTAAAAGEDEIDGDAAVREPDARRQLERQKAEAYAAIKEAEFDYQMGKLSDADFGLVRDKYAKQALEAIGALDTLSAARQRKESRRPTRIAFCPSCGAAVPPRANFCSGCGAALQEAVA